MADEKNEAAARTIIDESLKTDRFWKDYSHLDLAVIFGPSVMLVTIARLLLPGLLGPAYILAITLLLCWAGIVYVLPSWQTPVEFVKISWGSIMTPDSYEHVNYEYGTHREQKHKSPARFWQAEARTQDLTRVDQFPIGGDVVVRLDGVMVGGLAVSSSNMTLAGSDKWKRNVDSFQDFLENNLTFDVSITLPTRRFEKARYVEEQRDRLTDDDIRENPVAEAVCSDYADWLDRKLGGGQTATRSNYILVPVSKREVRHLEDEETIRKNIASIPILGSIPRWLSGYPVVGGFASRFDPEADIDDDEIRARQLEEVSDRLETVQQNCIEKLEGCSAGVMSDGEIADVIYSHWDGQEFEGDMDELLRKYPIIGAEDD